MSADAFPLSIASAPSRREPRESFTIFVAHAHAVARVTDPMLAEILAGILGGEAPRGERATWRGDRRAGLELCQRLLLYVRPETADRRIDVSLGYIAGELAAIGGPQAKAPRAH